MVKFKCKHTGNISEFNTEHDIKTMREHPEYVEIIENEVVEKEEPEKRAYKPKVK